MAHQKHKVIEGNRFFIDFFQYFVTFRNALDLSCDVGFPSFDGLVSCSIRLSIDLVTKISTY